MVLKELNKIAKVDKEQVRIVGLLEGLTFIGFLEGAGELLEWNDSIEEVF